MRQPLLPSERSLDCLAETSPRNPPPDVSDLTNVARLPSSFSSSSSSTSSSSRASQSPLSSSSCSSPSASALESTGDELLEQSEQLLRILDVVPTTETEASSPQLALSTNNSVVETIAREDFEDKDNEEGKDNAGRACSDALVDIHTESRCSSSINRASVAVLRMPKRIQYRKKTKLELEYLRACARELEIELQALQSGRARRPPLLTRESRNALLGTAWKHLAATQLRRRVQSEAENELLRRELQTYAEITRVLAQTLSRRPSGRFSIEALSRTKRRRGPITHDVEFFKDLVAELDPAYARLDSVLQATGVNKVATEMQRTFLPRRADAPPGLIEMCEVTVSPFDAWVFANSRWETTTRLVTQCKPGYLERMWLSGPTMASHMRSTRDERVWLRIAFKKYFDDVGRLVIVWRLHAECRSDEFAGYYLDETGWVVVEALTEQCPSGSIVRTCVQFQQRTKPAATMSLGFKKAPVESAKVRSGGASREIGEFAKLMIHTHAVGMDDLAGEVDSMLLGGGDDDSGSANQ